MNAVEHVLWGLTLILFCCHAVHSHAEYNPSVHSITTDALRAIQDHSRARHAVLPPPAIEMLHVFLRLGDVRGVNTTVYFETLIWKLQLTRHSNLNPQF